RWTTTPCSANDARPEAGSRPPNRYCWVTWLAASAASHAAFADPLSVVPAPSITPKKHVPDVDSTAAAHRSDPCGITLTTPGPLDAPGTNCSEGSTCVSFWAVAPTKDVESMNAVRAATTARFRSF